MKGEKYYLNTLKEREKLCQLFENNPVTLQCVNDSSLSCNAEKLLLYLIRYCFINSISFILQN